jgi:hypothetical protein
MIRLSRATKTRIRALFPQRDWPVVQELLEHECGDKLPFLEPEHAKLAERIRFAVVKLSAGNLEQLQRAVAEAQIDWRDTLMAAGFGTDTRTHKRWRPQVRT